YLTGCSINYSLLVDPDLIGPWLQQFWTTANPTSWNKQFKVDEVLADISRPRGLSILGPTQSQPQPQQPSQATDPKDKGKGVLVEEPKKKKVTLQQIKALETTNDEEVARKIQAEWDAEEERKRLEELKKAKPKTTSLAFEETYFSCSRKKSNDKFLKRSRIQEFAKT
ncbi:hypothetical protein Tco_1128131, partial [Tanacetum coccineum]